MSDSTNQASVPRPGGLSLYANLLDPSSTAPGTISKGPVVFKPADAAEEAPAKRPLDSAYEETAVVAKAKAKINAFKICALRRIECSQYPRTGRHGSHLPAPTSEDYVG
ncbi:G-patch DNA repair protein [Diplocarpon rosae]|nr:G-patch DNA repair protein [Diplocarpon rosae]